MSALNYARLLRSQQIDSLCIALENSPLYKKAQACGVPVISISPTASTFRKVLFLRDLLKQNYRQTVFVHQLRDLRVLWPATIGLKNLDVIGFAHMISRVSKKTPWHLLFYSRLRKLITFTQLQQDLIKPKLPVRGEKYSVIYPGVNCEKYNPSKRDQELRTELGATTDDCLVGVVARFDQQKGQLDFVEALNILSERGVGFKAVLVGAPTSGETQNNYEQKVAELVNQSGLGKQVKFIGFIEDTSKLMASLDLLCLPSHQETFGLVLLEAMASGTAVVATNAGGPPEIIGNDKALFVPKNPEDMANLLEKFINSPDERKFMGMKMRERALNNFNEVTFTQSLIALAQPASLATKNDTDASSKLKVS